MSFKRGSTVLYQQQKLTGLELQKKDKSIYNTVEEALSYLDQRTEFWRQQKPMYTRKREKELKKYKPKPTRPIGYPHMHFECLLDVCVHVCMQEFPKLTKKSCSNFYRILLSQLTLKQVECT